MNVRKILKDLNYPQDIHHKLQINKLFKVKKKIRATKGKNYMEEQIQNKIIKFNNRINQSNNKMMKIVMKLFNLKLINHIIKNLSKIKKK